MAGRGTTATMALERAKIPFTLHEYAHDPRNESYGTEASEALGVPAERVFKTLVAEVDGALVTGVRGHPGLWLIDLPSSLSADGNAPVWSRPSHPVRKQRGTLLVSNHRVWQAGFDYQ